MTYSRHITLSLTPFLFAIILAACSASSTDTTTSIADLPTGDAAVALNPIADADSSDTITDPATDTGAASGDTNLNVGTIAGNPTSKPVRQLTLYAVSDVPAGGDIAVSGNDSADSVTDDSGKAALKDLLSCMPFTIAREGSSSKWLCSVTPSEYNLGIRKIEFVQCADGYGEPIACQDPGMLTYTVVATLFDAGDGDGMRLDINENGTVIEFDAAEEDFHAVGGILFTVSHIEQRLPDTAVNPAGADKITPELHGKRYRVCATDHDTEAYRIATECGQDAARFGDVLMDLDGDDAFGFIRHDRGGFYESDERPDFIYRRMHVPLWYADIDFGGLIDLAAEESFVTILAGFDAPVDVTAQEDFTSRVTFDITDTFRFFDERTSNPEMPKLTFAPRVTSGAGASRREATSPGVYDPRDDIVVPQLPGVYAERDR